MSKIRPQSSSNRDSDWKFDKLLQICLSWRMFDSGFEEARCYVIYPLPPRVAFSRYHGSETPESWTTKIAPSCNIKSFIFIRIVNGKYGQVWYHWKDFGWVLFKFLVSFRVSFGLTELESRAENICLPIGLEYAFMIWRVCLPFTRGSIPSWNEDYGIYKGNFSQIYATVFT